MKPIINYTPIDLPKPLRRRMSEIRRERGTSAAHAYAHAVLSHLRHEANVAYMRRFVGSPGTLALRSLAFNTAVVVPILYLLWGQIPPATFAAALPISLAYILGRAVAAFIDGGRQ